MAAISSTLSSGTWRATRVAACRPRWRDSSTGDMPRIIPASFNRFMRPSISFSVIPSRSAIAFHGRDTSGRSSCRALSMARSVWSGRERGCSWCHLPGLVRAPRVFAAALPAEWFRSCKAVAPERGGCIFPPVRPGPAPAADCLETAPPALSRQAVRIAECGKERGIVPDL